jgi:hypothetical protein
MSKVFGLTERYSLIDTSGSKTLVNYGIEHVDEINSTWHEVSFSKAHGELPNINDVKEAIINDINNDTDAKILSGFVWNGVNVWLSEENQRNFSEAQRMAEKYGDAVLPLRFKLGEDSEGNPVYHTFETVAELDAFYTQAFRYVNQCLNEGWAIKDNFDWKPYEDLLPNPDLPISEA